MRKKIKWMLKLVVITSVINLILIGFFFYSNQKATKRYQTVLDEYIPHEEDFLHLSRDMYKLQSLTLTEIASKDPESSKAYLAEIDELKKCIPKTLTKYASFSQDDYEKKLLHEIYTIFSNYSSQQKEVSLLDEKDSLEKLHEHINSMGNKLNKMNSLLGELNVIMQENIDTAKNELTEANLTHTLLLSFICVFSSGLILVLIFVFRRLSAQLVSHIDIEFQHLDQQIIDMQSKTIESMAELVENRDGETGAHVRNTAFFVDLIAKKLAEDSPYKDSLTPEYIHLLKRYAPLHDVGKIVISDAILLKPARLTSDEFELMKKHTVEGGNIIDNILADIETPEHIQIARDIALYHHEKWDGSGYPYKLSGQDIPLCARIMSVADVFDALISKRCYKDAFSLEDAYDIIRESDGSQFDPIVVKAFFSAKGKIEDYISRTSTNTTVDK